MAAQSYPNLANLDELTTVRRGPSVGRLATGTFSPGFIIDGRYRIIRQIGRGGMALVYEAHDMKRGRRLALKWLRPMGSSMSVPRLIREASAASKLTSRHAVRVHGVERASDGTPFIAMELLEGVVLAKLGRLAPAPAVDLILQVLDAVGEAHALGIIHRDLKPHNLFVTHENGARVMKVLDFGIAKATWTDGHHTRTRDIVGSPAYMAPEQARSSRTLDGRADIWSIGVCLHEMLSGSSPFTAPNVAEILSNVLFLDPAPISGVPRSLSNVVLRCLAKDRADRWPDVASLANALAPFGSGARPPIVRRSRKRFWFVAFAALAIAGIAYAPRRIHRLHPRVVNVHDLPDAPPE